MAIKPETEGFKPETTEEENRLDSFLFYGREQAAEEKPRPKRQEISMGFEEFSMDTSGSFDETPLEEFIREKPRKVMDPSKLQGLHEKAPASHSKKRKGGGVVKVIAFVLVIALLIGGGYVYLTKDPGQYKKASEKFAALVTNKEGTNADDILKKYEGLYALNPDMVGYVALTSHEGEVAFPIVAMGDKDEKYLGSHLFDGTSNSYGTAYTKSDVFAEKQPDVVVVKGKDKSDCGLLVRNYLEGDVLNAPSTFRFDTLYEEKEWAVFSAFQYKNKLEDDYFLIDRENFLNDKLFREYINNFYDYSATDFDVDATPEEQILVLLAEGKEETYVLAARPLRSGETPEELDERVVVKTEKPEKKPIIDNDPEEDEDEENSSKEDTSSKEQSSVAGETASPSDTSSKKTEDTTSKKPTVSKPNPSKYPKPKLPSGMRYEQTGLVADMDKTAKVEMSNVVTLIDVVGLTKDKATDILENTLGLQVEVKEVDSEEKRGTVLRQSVADGAKLSADIPITITVSGGLAGGKTKVPELVGNSKLNVDYMLGKAELKLGKVTVSESSLEEGTILSQSPKAGEKVDYDTPIDIVISDGQGEIKIIDMPDLRGKTRDEAKNLIVEAGLRVGKITTVTSTKTAGTVIEQECPAGEKIEEGSVVAIKISDGSKVNDLTVTNISSWSVSIGGKTYAPGDIIKGDYMDIIPYIVEAEMGGGFNMEALKAQAVAAYCWLINSGSRDGAAPGVPMKNPTENAIAAAEEVKGVKVTHAGKTAETYYYAIAADYSANCKDVWWADISYLRAVPSEGDKYADGYKTTVTYSADELADRVLETYDIDLSDVNKSDWFHIEYDENNAYVRSVNIGGKETVTGSSMRDTLLQYELRSTAFKLKYNKSDDSFTFTVRGYGHGVGMSQVGANYYAGKGWDYEKILTHYYPGTAVE